MNEKMKRRICWPFACLGQVSVAGVQRDFALHAGLVPDDTVKVAVRQADFTAWPSGSGAQ
jgi:hypothetical protein